jgi:putative membrane protein
MITPGREFSEAVERAVRDAERGTAAELIVVVAARSGSYLDVALAVGAVAAALTLLVALFAPVGFRAIAIAAEVPLAFALAAWIAHRMPRLLRALTPAGRLRLQAERAAAAHFLAEAVHGTRGRTGLLVYLSLLEECVVILPDLGLQGRVPLALLEGVRWSPVGDPQRPRTEHDVLHGIAALGELLRAKLPADGTDANESPDAPRIFS